MALIHRNGLPQFKSITSLVLSLLKKLTNGKEKCAEKEPYIYNY